jgi:TonB family protein
MNTAIENKNRITAMALTITFHALLFLLFIFIVFVTPIPPFEIKPTPEIEMDLGMEGSGNTDAGGSGKNDTDIKTTEESVPQPTHQTITTAVAPATITDPTENSVSIKTNPHSTTEQTIEAPKVEEVPKPSRELLNALNALKNKHKHIGDGQGTGNTGGSGNGNAQGIGDGDGMGHGDGTLGYNGSGNNYELRGRKLMRKPDQMTDSQEEGTVVVEIVVDETGKVIKATPGQRGSTTTSSNLFAKARQAALSAKFNPSPEGIKEQRGSYSFVFVLE